MTERKLFEFYLTCIVAAIGAWYIFQHPAAPVIGFIGTAALQTFDSQTRKRP